jgi:hypothetical protein
MALEERYTNLQDVSMTSCVGVDAAPVAKLLFPAAQLNNHAKKAKLMAFPILAAMASRPISLDHLFSCILSRIALRAAAQQQLNAKSTTIQYPAK